MSNFGSNSLDVADGLGLNKSARLDNQRQPEQYSPRYELQLNPTFPYRLIPFQIDVLIKATDRRTIPL
jgi:hypothetical protein